MDALTQPHNFPGKLIIVEGIDGSGKSTQLQLGMRYLQAKGFPIFFYRMEQRGAGEDSDEARQEEDEFDAADVFVIARHGFCASVGS